jgi:hypothetical protein
VAQQELGGASSHRDAVDVLNADHHEIELLLADVRSGEALPGDSTGERHLSVAIAEFARHIVIEEEYLYPLAQEVVPDGHRLAAEGVRQGRQAEEVMKRLEAATPTAERAPLVDELVGILARHVQLTEGDLFPALRQECEPDQLEHLAGVLELARRTAPSHAHPGAPHDTPWNQILAPGIGLVDKVRDAVRGRPTRPEDL